MLRQLMLVKLAGATEVKVKPELPESGGK